MPFYYFGIKKILTFAEVYLRYALSGAYQHGLLLLNLKFLLFT